MFFHSIIEIKLENKKKKKNHQADNRIIVVCCVFAMDGGLKRKPGLNAGKISTACVVIALQFHKISKRNTLRAHLHEEITLALLYECCR